MIEYFILFGECRIIEKWWGIIRKCLKILQIVIIIIKVTITINREIKPKKNKTINPNIRVKTRKIRGRNLSKSRLWPKRHQKTQKNQEKQEN